MQPGFIEWMFSEAYALLRLRPQVRLASAPRRVWFPSMKSKRQASLGWLRLPGAAATAWLLVAADRQTNAGERLVRQCEISAEVAFEEGQEATHLMRRKDGGIGLYDAELLEDDGPAIGSDVEWLKADRAPVTEIHGDRRVAVLANRLIANFGGAGATPVLRRFSEPLRSAGEKRWLTGFYLDQPEEWDYPYRFFRW